VRQRRDFILEVITFVVFFILCATVWHAWYAENTAMLYSIMDCMPDGSREAYNVCYEEYNMQSGN